MSDLLHVLIVDDHQDVVENLERKISDSYTNIQIKTSTDCDTAFQYIKTQKVINPINLLVLDLSFNNNKLNAILKEGFDLLKALKDSKLNYKTIIYTSHKTIYHIHPVMETFSPEAYVIKTHNSNPTLLHAIQRVLAGDTYYDPEVIEACFTRVGYEKKLDDIDKSILDHLPNIKDAIADWDGVIIKKDGTPMSYTSIKLRIDKLLTKFEVETQGQLLIKLQKSGLLK